MFNGTGYSLADISAATRGNEDGFFGGNCVWWIFLLFLFGWGGGNGWGGNNDTRAAVEAGFDYNQLANGIRGLEHGLCDGFYEMNTAFGNTNMAAMQNTNTIMGRLADMAAQSYSCCCETQRLLERGLCEVNYNILTQSNGINTSIASAARDIIENNNNGVRSILDFLTQDKIAALTAENQSLKLAASQQAQNNYLVGQLRPAPVPAYQVPNPFVGCGCNPCGAYAY